MRRLLPLWLLILMLTLTPVVASADDGSSMARPDGHERVIDR